MRHVIRDIALYHHDITRSLFFEAVTLEVMVYIKSQFDVISIGQINDFSKLSIKTLKYLRNNSKSLNCCNVKAHVVVHALLTRTRGFFKLILYYFK